MSTDLGLHNLGYSEDDRYAAQIHMHDPEMGWGAVANGLNLIFFGYIIFLVNIVGVVWFHYSFDTIVKPFQKISSVDWREIVYTLGMGLAGLIWLISYWMTLLGLWRSLNAPERLGTKWFIFICITCIVIGPLLTIFAYLYGGVNGFASMKFEGLAGFMQLVSFIFEAVSIMMFLLFLRAVTCCFESPGRTGLVTLFLVLTGALIAGSCYLYFGDHAFYFSKAEFIEAFRGDKLAIRSQMPYLALVFCTFMWMIGYLVVVGSVRNCIAREVNKPKEVSPVI